MRHQISSKDQTFRSSFEACITTPTDFNHKAHVRLAYIYLCENEPNAAYQKMPDAIQAFLVHYRIDPSKYHETLTRAWTLAVRHFMASASPAASADDFISSNARLLDTRIMLTHYSEATLFSEKARLTFVEPDLDAIPQ